MPPTFTPVPEITDATFADQVLASDLPILVEFTAAWCPPCRMVAPVLAQVAAEQEGRLRIVSIDVDHNPESQAAYGVLSMPTMILFTAGEPVKSVVGARSRTRLLKEFGL